MDSAIRLIKAVLDRLRKTLALGVTTPPSRTESVTNEKITKTKNVEKESKDTSSKQVAVQAEQTRRVDQSSGESKSEPDKWAIFVSKVGWAVFAVIVLGFVFWYFKIKRGSIFKK